VSCPRRRRGPVSAPAPRLSSKPDPTWNDVSGPNVSVCAANRSGDWVR
jgi:hypothetical protein